LTWVLSLWQGAVLAVALDATSLGDRFVVLTVSVLYRSCAIPVAWVVVPAGNKGAWRPQWLRLLRRLWCAVPGDMTVLVLTDRGLYARWLYRRIVRLGWHPLMRINTGGFFRPEGSNQSFRPLSSFAFQPGSQWCGRGQAFKNPAGRLACTFVAQWQTGRQEPWLLLTDLAPTAVDAAWYGLRMWVEASYKTVKSGGWQWQHTRMTDPRRAERLWLAVAVATLWLLSVGTAAETSTPATPFEDLAAALVPPVPRSRRATRLRLVSVFRRGWCRLLVALLRLECVLPDTLTPEPWPTLPDSATGRTLCPS
jgi:hypothetical protein